MAKVCVHYTDIWNVLRTDRYFKRATYGSIFETCYVRTDIWNVLRTDRYFERATYGPIHFFSIFRLPDWNFQTKLHHFFCICDKNSSRIWSDACWNDQFRSPEALLRNNMKTTLRDCEVDEGAWAVGIAMGFELRAPEPQLISWYLTSWLHQVRRADVTLLRLPAQNGATPAGQTVREFRTSNSY